MAPTKRKTKHKPERNKAGEQVLDLVISYIYAVEDQNSLSLVSRKFYEIDGITRKRLTVHTHCYPNPSRLSKRFPFIESLTPSGPPSHFMRAYRNDIQITPWIEQLSLEFRCLKELNIRHQVVHDEDLETLARTRGKDLRSLKIIKCEGFSSKGLRHISKYCNQLRTLCLNYSDYINTKDGIWLHQLALNSTLLERLHVKYTDASSAEDLTLLAKNCCNSLISKNSKTLTDLYENSLYVAEKNKLQFVDTCELIGEGTTMNSISERIAIPKFYNLSMRSIESL